ncbi:MAG: helix-hairpin-helix domain-containing protein [Bacteroidales bacterium]|nr:helix-hairpin-helix domain-containing protein [Bacteroidales bacterium]
MKPYAGFLIILIPLFPSTIFCQETPLEKNIDPLLEEIVENHSDNYDENTDFSELSNELYYLSQHPINLNNTNKQGLSRLFFLSEREINNILRYVDYYGPVQTIYELQGAENVSKQSLRWMEAFVTFEKKEESQAAGRWFNHEILYRTDRKLEQQKGYISDSSEGAEYLGDPYRQYFRYNVETQNISAGLTADKDAGESFFSAPNNKGFDFYSGHLKIENMKFVSRAIVGDYKLQFGQGLNLWSGFSMGKSPTLSGIKKYGYGLKAYRSSNEATYMRGIGITTNWNNLTLTTFYSRKKWDGNRVFNTDSTEYWVTSLKEAGYHRTDSEWKDRNSVTEQLTGFNLSLDKDRWHVGLTGWHSGYDHPIKPQERLYNYFRFSGRENLIGGLDVSKVFDKGQFYSEWSMDKEGDMAMLAGANFFLDSRLTLKTVYRNYSKYYNNFYSNALAEGSRTNDEEGFLLGAVFLMFDDFSLKGYADFFKSRWIGFRTSSPSKGQEYSLQLNYNPSRNFQGYLRLQQETKDYNSPAETQVQRTIPRKRTKLRAHFSQEVSEAFTLKNRIEKSIIDYPGEKSEGFLIYQDVRYAFQKAPLTLTGRFAMFDTDDYASRLYAYENDVLYSFSFPAYYDKGRRVYLLVKYEIISGFTAWVRFSRTKYNHRQTVLSGYNEIEGNAVSEVKLQLRMKL